MKIGFFLVLGERAWKGSRLAGRFLVCMYAEMYVEDSTRCCLHRKKFKFVVDEERESKLDHLSMSTSAPDSQNMATRPVQASSSPSLFGIEVILLTPLPAKFYSLPQNTFQRK